MFRGAGWNVIKVIWGREWDPLFARRQRGRAAPAPERGRRRPVAALHDRRAATYIREQFFGSDPRLLELVKHLTDEQIGRLRRGGHNCRKVYAAYQRGRRAHGAARPSSWRTPSRAGTLGESFEGSNVTHQKKKMTADELTAFRDRLELPDPRRQARGRALLPPGHGQPRGRVHARAPARARRRSSPAARESRSGASSSCRAPSMYEEFFEGIEEGRGVDHDGVRRACSPSCSRDKKIGRRIVPIIPDEARTFGMDAAVQPGGHLRRARAALRADRQGQAALLPRGQGRPGARRGHHRGRLDGVVHRRGHVVRRCTASR